MRKSEPVPPELRGLAEDARVTVRRGGAPGPQGKCVVYWMERAQRGRDNHAVDLAVAVANALWLPLVVYFSGGAGLAGSNLRQYAFLQRGLADVEADLAERNIAFVLRNGPNEPCEQFLSDAGAAFLVGDENPMREPERWRRELAARIRIPFWTVDADVVVPSKLMERGHYGRIPSDRGSTGCCRNFWCLSRTRTRYASGNGREGFTEIRCGRVWPRGGEIWTKAWGQWRGGQAVPMRRWGGCGTSPARC